MQEQLSRTTNNKISAVLSTPFFYLKTGSLIKRIGIKAYRFYTNPIYRLEFRLATFDKKGNRYNLLQYRHT
jgi:hypothetical protein